ncbi:hypothetical protein M0722_16230 [Microbacterium sp. KSW4-16]|uniref:hypothetical protein n=1 Tax=Microbacterium aurugineum TaxID=2851642 RepID=UPI0020C01F4C|nr:hypothetical protein [Microbacterium aurugineum]MCK8468744.1 hypothetical protein [Microbacterium aurugineum]
MTSPDIVELVRRLTAALGSTLVSTLAGATDTRAALSWSADGGLRPDGEASKRLECADAAWRTVSHAESDQAARLWFIGANPFLRGEDSVITANREGRFDEVVGAAQALANDSFSG